MVLDLQYVSTAMIMCINISQLTDDKCLVIAHTTDPNSIKLNEVFQMVPASCSSEHSVICKRTLPGKYFVLTVFTIINTWGTLQIWEISIDNNPSPTHIWNNGTSYK